MAQCESCGAELDTSTVLDHEWKEYDMVICDDCDRRHKFIGSKCILGKKGAV